ncbi:MAG: peptide chain release factor N(5)-glutamine methyltransferase [Desulfobacterales bacterium]
MALLTWTQSYFKSHGLDTPRLDAELLLSHAIHCRRIDLYLRHDQPLNTTELRRYKTLIRRRANREPVAYILGEREFWSRKFEVNPQVLIPRPETETLLQAALDALGQCDLRKPARVLELGTGSGAIIVTLAAELPGHLYVAMDRSLGALKVAQNNARRHLPLGSIHFYCGSWLDSFYPHQSEFDLLISNPPYIARPALEGLAPEIHAHEPRRALDGGHDGLTALREIITAAPGCLKPGGWLLLEIGYDQADAVHVMVESQEMFDSVQWTADLAGHRRVAKIRKKTLRACF